MSSLDGSPFDVGSTEQGEAEGKNLAEDNVSIFGSSNMSTQLDIPEGTFSSDANGNGIADIPIAPSAVAPNSAFNNILHSLGVLANPLASPEANGAAIKSIYSGGQASPASALGSLTISRVITVLLGVLIFSAGLFLLGKPEEVLQRIVK